MASKALEISILPDPAVALLNLKPIMLNRHKFQLLINLTTAAKQTIAKAWNLATLIVAEAKHRMHKTLIYAKMSVIEDDNIVTFQKILKPWVKHFLPSDFGYSLLLPQ